METVLHRCSHWLLLRGGVVPTGGGAGSRRLSSHVLIPFFFPPPTPNPPSVHGHFSGTFCCNLKAATPKMEAPCAAIKREPSEIFPVRLQRPSQDGRPCSGTPLATPNMVSLNCRFGAQRVPDITHTSAFFSAGRTVGCWVRGARWILIDLCPCLV